MQNGLPVIASDVGLILVLVWLWLALNILDGIL